MTKKEQLFNIINSKRKTHTTFEAFYICTYNKSMKAPLVTGFFVYDFDHMIQEIEMAYDDDLSLRGCSDVKIYGYFDKEKEEWIYLTDEGVLKDVRE